MPSASHPIQISLPLFREDSDWLLEFTKEARREWARARRSGDPAKKAMALSHLSGCISDLEGPAAALRLTRRAHKLWEEVGDPSKMAMSRAVLAVRLLEAGLPHEALRQSSASVLAMRGLGPQKRHKNLPHYMGKKFLMAGYAEEAQAWLEMAIENPAEGERAGILAHLSRSLDLQGKLQEARERQFEACKAFHLQEEPFSLAKGMLSLARLDLRLGRRWEAGTLCQEVLRILQGHGYNAEVAKAQELKRLCHGGQWPPPAGMVGEHAHPRTQ